MSRDVDSSRISGLLISSFFFCISIKLQILIRRIISPLRLHDTLASYFRRFGTTSIRAEFHPILSQIYSKC